MSDAPASELKFSHLSPARRHLVMLMQAIKFGRIEGLVVRNYEPVLHPKPKVVLEVKFGCTEPVRPYQPQGDFTLKAQVVELFSKFDDDRHLRIPVLTIKHGLPFHMQVEAFA